MARDRTRRDTRASRSSTPRSVPGPLSPSPGTCPILGLKTPESRVYAQCCNAAEFVPGNEPTTILSLRNLLLAVLSDRTLPRDDVSASRKLPFMTGKPAYNHNAPFNALKSRHRGGCRAAEAPLRGAADADTIFRLPASGVLLHATCRPQAHCRVGSRGVASCTRGAVRGAEDTDTVFWLPLIVQTLFPKFEIPASREPHFKPSEPPAARRSPESEVEVRFFGLPASGGSSATGIQRCPRGCFSRSWKKNGACGARNFLPRASATSLKTSPAAHWVNGQTPVSNRNKPSSSLRESNTKLGPQNGLPGHVKYNFLPRGA
ncbi:hypothetical protein DFH06DRAFT_1133467 [Mycena polygramma]|nr:hypothetical protein DFH06DRAFT_1133467 [Mycena polygramma]